jgi:DNA mismatch repair protein MutS
MLPEYFKKQKEYETKYGKNTLLLYQVGMFIECYCTETEGYPVKELSLLLNIQYTKKNKALPISKKNAAMIGWPLPVSKKYIRILLQNNFTLAIYHQKDTNGKITRERIGLYTPSTYLEEDITEDTPNNNDTNIICLYFDFIEKDTYLICASQIDLTTGKGSVLVNTTTECLEQYSVIQNYLKLFQTREIVYACSEKNRDLQEILDNLDIDNSKYFLQKYTVVNQTNIAYQNEVLTRIYGKEQLLSQIERLNLEKYPELVTSWIILVDYVYEHNPKVIKNIDYPELILNNNYLLLENNAIEQLNLITNNALEISNKKYQSVYHVINNCLTCFGKRYLKTQLLQPLIDTDKINERYLASKFMKNKMTTVYEILSGVIDIEKLNRRMSIDSISPFELKNLYLTYKKLSQLKDFEWDTPFLSNVPEFKLLDVLESYFTFDSFEDECYFKKGIFKELDNLEKEINSEQSKITEYHVYLNKLLNEHERKEINGIKLEFSDTSGYYFSLSTKRANVLDKIITKEDREILTFKSMPRSATSKIYLTNQVNLELLAEYKVLIKKCWLESCSTVYILIKNELKEIVEWVSRIDFIYSNLKTAQNYKYVCPTIIENETKSSSFVEFTEMRHPIIERLVKDTQMYITHNISLGKEKDGILLFGLNSAGKSSMMKSIGVNIILAQCGLYVPCKKMEYFPYKSLFTRITGNDNLFKGMSSFTVEMFELNNILKYSTECSLVIGDEICRGTETISACSIVSAILILLSKRKSSFIFASHLHDLTQIKDITDLPNLSIKHLKITIDTENEKLIYNRTLEDGPGSSIYGITVAKFIIKEPNFVNLTERFSEIHKQLHSQGHTNGNSIRLKLVEDKRSRYNSKKFVSNCEKCGKKASYNGELETHHNIITQEQCDDDGFFNHLHKNSLWNLKVLCSDCHDLEHNNS